MDKSSVEHVACLLQAGEAPMTPASTLGCSVLASGLGMHRALLPALLDELLRGEVSGWLMRELMRPR